MSMSPWRRAATCALLFWPAACLLVDPFDDLADSPPALATDDGGTTDTPEDDADAGGEERCDPGVTRPCTRATCHGEQRCGDAGRWERCDARDASIEICSTAESESCLGDGRCTGDTAWALALGDGTTQGAADVAVDADGYVYVVGTFHGSMPQLGLVRDGGSELVDSFVAKLTPGGAVVWSRQIADARLVRIALAPGGIVVAGNLHGSTSLPGCSPLASAGSADAIVVRLSRAGDCLVGASFGEGSTLSGVAVDWTSDDVLVTGRLDGTVSFGGPDGGVVLSSESPQGYYVRLDPSLRGRRGLVVPSTGRVALRGVAASHSGWSVAYGSFTGSIFSSSPAAFEDGFTLLVDRDDVLRNISTFGNGPIFAATFDPSDRMLLVGTFNGVMDLTSKGGPRIEAKRPNEPFVVRRALALLTEIEAVGLDVPVYPRAVGADARGNVLVAGDYDHPEAGVPGNASDVFVAKYDATSLSPLWSRLFGDGRRQQAFGVTADALGSVVVAGTFRGTLDLGSGLPALAANGPGSVNTDALVLKLLP